MKVLVACEFSGIVREAFKRRGHFVLSCDFLRTEIPGNHYRGNVLDVLENGWDLMIAHPPCTFLCVSGARWVGHPNYPNREKDRDDAIKFFMRLANAPINKIAIENPIGIMSTRYKKPNQIIQPYEYGNSASKKTCLWLKNLPELIPTNIVPIEYVASSSGRKWEKWFWETSLIPYKKRGHKRSITFQGIADAMAEQWG